MREELQHFFWEPASAKHRQYEALRAYVLEGLSAKQAGEKFGLAEKSIYVLASHLRAGQLQLFAQAAPGPKDRRATPHLKQMLIQLRKQGLSVSDIVLRLKEQELALSPSTVERLLKDAGFSKLPRRTRAEQGLSVNNTWLPEPAQNLDFSELKPFTAECQVAGAFLFLPYILESGILETFQDLPLPESSRIGRVQAGLSFLLLKLIGGERLSHIHQYDHDLGFGVFAGLNVLPKPTYMCTYSRRISEKLCLDLQAQMLDCFIKNDPERFNGETINLDFHSIPHFGEQSAMEKVWAGSRGQALKGANTFFAQDGETKALYYANADVLRNAETQEILKFVEYLRHLKGVVDQTLVFDSRLTNYSVLNELDQAGVKFITLRRRGKKLLDETAALPDSAWQKVKLDIPKRKHQKFLVHESEALLKNCARPFRQIIMKDHGREDPSFVITNNRILKLLDVLRVYARRWRIENKLSELVDFFNLNRLSSPIMARIYFDILLSVAASFLYQRFAGDLPRFEKHPAPDIFSRFVDMPGRVRFDGEGFEVHLRKRAHTPILMGVEKLNRPVNVPWLEGRPLKIIWRA